MRRFVICLFCLFAFYSAVAQVPELIHYQGRATHTNSLLQGIRTVEMNLFEWDSGGTALYGETQAVSFVDGLYTFALGASNAMPGSLEAAITNDGSLYVEVTIDGTTLTPRERVQAVAYAILAGGVEPGAIQTEMLADGAVSTAKLDDQAVSGGKLGSNAVSSTHIADSAITSNKIAASAIGSEHIRAQSIRFEDLTTEGVANGQVIKFTSFAWQATNALDSYSESGPFSPGPEAAGYGSIAMGAGCLTYSPNSVISGGYSNRMNSGCTNAVIGGGRLNVMGADCSHALIGGGRGNNLFDRSEGAVILGGQGNLIAGYCQGASILGGSNNVVNSQTVNCMIGGGHGNQIGSMSRGAIIGGGESNDVGYGAQHSVIGSGRNNEIRDASSGSIIVGGTDHTIGYGATNCFISHGSGHLIGNYSHGGILIGGHGNELATGSVDCIILGGTSNYACGDRSFVVGHYARAEHPRCFIWSPGYGLESTEPSQFLIHANKFGFNTTRTYNDFTVMGWGSPTGGVTGYDEVVARFYQFGTYASAISIDGQYQEDAILYLANSNAAVWDVRSDYSYLNKHTFDVRYHGQSGLNHTYFTLRTNGYAGIGLSWPENPLHVEGWGSTNGGNGSWQEVVGRFKNTRSGDHTALAIDSLSGYDSTLFFAEDGSAYWDMRHDASWFDSFQVRYHGGVAANTTYLTILTNGYVGIGTDSPGYPLVMAGGAYCDGNDWVDVSDRAKKENFTPVNTQEILDKVADLPITKWNYRSDDPAVRHIGPTAQDFYAAFGLGQNDKGIASADRASVALAAVQGLYEQVQSRDAILEKQAAYIRSLEARIRRLETSGE